jgi:AcrR family transcriptional regulator
LARPSAKAEKREQILDGLFDAMAREGSAGASVSDIAKAAGIARGALHYYFDSKDEIRVELMRKLGAHYNEGLSGALDDAPEREISPLASLVRYHFAGDEPHAARLLGVWIDFWGQAPSDAGIGEVVLEVQEQARALARRAVLEHRPELGALPEAELRSLSAAVLAMIEGGLLQWRIAFGSDRAIDRRALSARLVDAAEGFVRAHPTPTSTLMEERP